MTEQKVVGRKIAIGLGIVCVALSVGLVVALAAYLPTTAQIDSLNTQMAEKDQAVAGLNLQITVLQSQINSLNSSGGNVEFLQNQISDLDQEIQSLYNVLYLNASTSLLNNQGFSMGPNTNVTIWNQPENSLLYAGYLTVQVQSASNLTYVQVIYNSHGVAYDNVASVSNNTAAFPVLPGQIVIVLGNTELTDSVTATATATYHY